MTIVKGDAKASFSIHSTPKCSGRVLLISLDFVHAHLEATTDCIQTKQRAQPRVSWETLAVRKKRADVKAATKCNERNPTNIHALKL